MRIVILGAFQDELTHIINAFPGLQERMVSKCRCLSGQWQDHDLFLALSGIGTSASAITTTIFCERLQPDLIIFCGVAGGLKLDQQIGDLVLANTIIDVDLHLLPTILKDTPYKNALVDPHTLENISANYPVHEALSSIIETFEFEGLKCGTIVTSNIFPAPKSLFEEIKQLNCSAVEMESAGIYKAAEYYNVPVVTLRSISNLLDEFGNDLGTKHDALQICSERLAKCLLQFLSHLDNFKITNNDNLNEAYKLRQKYDLEPHPEGGWYKRIFQSQDIVIAQGAALMRYHNEPRLAGTAIMYLLEEHDFSAWHSVQSDETWCFHSGHELLLRIIDSAGQLKKIKLGHDSEYLQFTVRAGEVFCVEPLGKFSLVSCVVTPGFDFKDFHLVSREEFLKLYSQHPDLLKFIREK